MKIRRRPVDYLLFSFSLGANCARPEWWWTPLQIVFYKNNGYM